MTRCWTTAAVARAVSTRACGAAKECKKTDPIEGLPLGMGHDFTYAQGARVSVSAGSVREFFIAKSFDLQRFSAPVGYVETTATQSISV